MERKRLSMHIQTRWRVAAIITIKYRATSYAVPSEDLKQMTALETLDLEINQIGDKGCEYLAPVLKQMTALEVLNLHYNKIGDKGCEALAPVLKQMTALKELTLWSNQIGDEGKVLIKSVFSGYDVKF
eukprot:Stramenopile-MAST_4_protein_20